MNKQLLSILSVVVSVALALGIYLYFAQIEDKNIKPIAIVPDNAVFILESNASNQHLRELTSPAFFDRLLGNDKVAAFYQQIKTYDSLFKTDNIISDWFADGQAVYSLHTFNRMNLGFFMAVQTGADVDPALAGKFFEKHYPGRYKISQRKFQNEILFDFTDFKEGSHFTIAFKSKLMLFSPDGALVELALLKTAKLLNGVQTEDKLAFVKNSGNGLNFYLNYAGMPDLTKNFTDEKFVNAFDLSGVFAEKSVFNVETDDEELLLKGASLTHETNFQFLDLLNAQAPIENTLHELLPENLNFSVTLSFNGYPSFYKNVNEYLLSHKLLLPYRQYADSIEKNLQFPFIEKMAAGFENHAALLSVHEPGISLDSSYVIAVECNDVNRLKQLFMQMNQAVKLKYEHDSVTYTADTPGLIHPVYIGQVFKYYFSDLFDGFQVNYAIPYKGYYFFASTKNTLEALQQKWNQGKGLAKNNEFNAFRKKLVPGSNFEIIINNEYAPSYALNFLNKDWFSILNQNMGSFKKVKFAGVQFAGSNDKIFATQIYLKFNVAKAEKTEKVWTVSLDSGVCGKPSVVYNFSLAQHVILAQDKSKKLYMIDRDGHIQWKIPLDDEIISEISELDLYANGKRQWLFNTRKFIYLIDDQGKAISGWPVWIPTGTHLPVFVFDPLKDRNYQIFTAGNLYKIAAFNIQGKLISYWNPKEVWPNLISSVSTFECAAKTYFWALNEKGKLTILDQQAHAADPLHLDSSYSFYHVNITQKDTNALEILGLDSDFVYIIKWHSAKKPEQVKLAAPGFREANWVNNNSGKLILLKAPDKFTLIDLNGKILASRTQNFSGLKDPAWQWVGPSMQIVYFDSTASRLHIENSKQEPYKPFPLNCKGSWRLGNLFNEADNWLLLQDETDKLNLYRIK